MKDFDYVKQYIEYSNIKANKSYGVYLKRPLKEQWDILELQDIKQSEQKKQNQELLKLSENEQLESRRQLKIKIVDNLIPEQEQLLRDYIYTQKNKKPVRNDKQNKRSQYKKSTLVMYLYSYLSSIVKEYINSVSTDEVRKWFKRYTQIKDTEVFYNIIHDTNIKFEGR